MLCSRYRCKRVEEGDGIIYYTTLTLQRVKIIYDYRWLDVNPNLAGFCKLQPSIQPIDDSLDDGLLVTMTSSIRIIHMATMLTRNKLHVYVFLRDLASRSSLIAHHNHNSSQTGQKKWKKPTRVSGTLSDCDNDQRRDAERQQNVLYTAM